MINNKTTRENIIGALIELLDSIEIKKVFRGKKGDITSEFKALPDTDFPLIVLDCGLPQPNVKYSSRQKGTLDEVLSNLNIDVYVYLRANDEAISKILQQIWSAIWKNPRLGNVLQISISPDSRVFYEDHYSYFTISLNFFYRHDGISI